MGIVKNQVQHSHYIQGSDSKAVIPHSSSYQDLLEGMLKHAWLDLTLRVSDSVISDGAQELAFLTRSRLMLLVLVW